MKNNDERKRIGARREGWAPILRSSETTLRKLIASAAMAIVMAACTGGKPPKDCKSVDEWPQIYPYYINVTIPSDMAPLNFRMADSQVTDVNVEVRGANGGSLRAEGHQAEFNSREWESLTAKNAGSSITFTVYAKKNGEWVRYRDFKVNIR